MGGSCENHTDVKPMTSKGAISNATAAKCGGSGVCLSNFFACDLQVRFFLIFYGFTDPREVENHATLLENVAKARSLTFRKGSFRVTI